MGAQKATVDKNLCEREMRTQAELLGSEKGGLKSTARAAVDLEQSEHGVGSRDCELGITWMRL